MGRFIQIDEKVGSPMKKFAFSTLLAFLTVVLVLAGCSKGSNSGQSSKETASSIGDQNSGTGALTYWYPWGGDSEKWDKWRIGQFEKANSGTKVTAVYVPEDGGITNGKLIAAISGKNPPDLVITSEYQAAYALAAQGALEPLDDLMAKRGFDVSEIMDPFLPLMKYKDKTYLFPQDSNVQLLYYNVKMFRDAGLDPDNPPRTIAELDAAADKLSKVDNGKIDHLGFIPWLDAGDGAYLWGWIFGADFYDANANTVKLSDDHLANLYTWMNTYAKKYNPEKIKSFSSGFGGAFSPDHPFFTGKVAMTVNGNWFANALKLYAPNVEYRVAPIPYPEGGRENATTFDTNVFLIPKGAKNKEAAMKFILFGGQGDMLADNINTWRSISVYKKQSDAIKWIKNGDAVYKTVLDIAASKNSGHPALTAVSKEMGNELTLIRDAVIYNDKDPKPLLEAAGKKLQAEADKKK
jgi:multiple sugar transport system substrate-binding protein